LNFSNGETLLVVEPKAVNACLLNVQQSAATFYRNLTQMYGRTTKVSRIILQPKGVVLSMLQNVKKLCIKNIHLRIY